MIRLFLLLFSSFLWIHPSTAGETNGMCQVEQTLTGLPKAICQLPSCPSGGDCVSPTINQTSARISFQEPLLRWTEVCPESISSPCWEVFVDVDFRLQAYDPSGVRAIGVNIIEEVDGKRAFRKYWANSQGVESTGTYALQTRFATHVRPGQRLELSVYEICAKDFKNNEGCVLPRASGFSNLVQ